MPIVMTAPISAKPPFWQSQDNDTGHCDERIVSQIWSLDIGPKENHWDLYASYSQENLRHEVESNWSAWPATRPVNSYVPWVWALKVYLWRFPLDIEFFKKMRHDMGPFWLLHVRHSDNDWAWFYSMRPRVPVNVQVSLLGMLPTHPVGKALAVDIPPVFEGCEAFELFRKDRSSFVMSQPALALLDNYGDVLLHPDSHFYPRWRAMLICVYNSLLQQRKNKKKTTNSLVQDTLEKSCTWLVLTPRTLWKGFDAAWIDFAKNKACTSLDAWDAQVVAFSEPKDWRSRLREQAANNTKATTLA